MATKLKAAADWVDDESMNESEFIELYTEITECAETRARSVYMVMSESFRSPRNRVTTTEQSPAADRANPPAFAPPDSERMP